MASGASPMPSACHWQCSTLTLHSAASRQGIDDAESEWSQHHAKRMIDTRDKGLRGSIPPNFPYFHVEFGLSGDATSAGPPQAQLATVGALHGVQKVTKYCGAVLGTQ